MNIDECLKKLEEACKNLENIGNVLEFKKNHPDKLFSMILPVIQYYKYIQTKFKTDEFAKVESMGMVLEIAENNPSLKGVVNSIIEIKHQKNKQQDFDKTALVNKITATVNEFRSQFGINIDTVDDYVYFFEKYIEELKTNKHYFSEEEYQGLVNIILNELNKISSVNNLIENNPSIYKM